MKLVRELWMTVFIDWRFLNSSLTLLCALRYADIFLAFVVNVLAFATFFMRLIALFGELNVACLLTFLVFLSY